jgi:conjugative transfer signal peptidase TraF
VTTTPSDPTSPARTRLCRWRPFLWLFVEGLCGSILLGSVLGSCLTVNVTSSMPRGLYFLDRSKPIERGTVVCLPVPPNIRPLVNDRHYLPPNFRLLKKVVALPGDQVCLDHHSYVVGGAPLSVIADHDHLGRPLPAYSFCSTVPPGSVFLIAHGDSSLDSRYFGPVPFTDLTAAVPLWTSSSP